MGTLRHTAVNVQALHWPAVDSGLDRSVLEPVVYLLFGTRHTHMVSLLFRLVTTTLPLSASKDDKIVYGVVDHWVKSAAPCLFVYFSRTPSIPQGYVAAGGWRGGPVAAPAANHNIENGECKEKRLYTMPNPLPLRLPYNPSVHF